MWLILETHRDNIILPGNIKIQDSVMTLVGATLFCLLILVVILFLLAIYLTGLTGIGSLHSMAGLAGLCIIIICILSYKLKTNASSVSPTTLPSYLSTLPGYSQVHLQRNI